MGSDTPEQSYDESEWGQDGLGKQVSAEHHSDNQHSHQETQEPDFSLGNASNIVGDAATNEDYEPDSPPADPVPDIAVLIKPNKPNKPKTSAGFIVASSDGEDDEDTVPVSTRSGLASRLGKTPGMAPRPGMSQSRDQVVPLPTLPQGTQVTNGEPVRHPGRAEPQVTAAAERSSFDPNGHLEARIKADPRGDMDAWLALISAYRTKGNLDDIRGVYHRFVHTFPHGVRISVVSSQEVRLTAGRRLFGLSGSS
jgi:cleavage stimulation factor subunit 3